MHLGTGLREYYLLDFASVVPAVLLQVQPGMSVLDMCAAPGGKSFIIAQQLFSSTVVSSHGHAPADSTVDGQEANVATASDSCACGIGAQSINTSSTEQVSMLVCNEPDAGRRARLQRVIDEHLSKRARWHTKLTGHEADKYWARNQANTYDRVLIDAPCSSDRHVLQQSLLARGVIPKSHWSLQGCKKLADLQFQLVCSGIRCLRKGGILVYSTCSMTPVENDEVVARVLQRYGSTVEVLPIAHGAAAAHDHLMQASGAEHTKCGILCLPDTKGWGPLYVAVLTKVSDNLPVASWSSKLPELCSMKNGNHEEEVEQEGVDEGS